jgi:hypothetical protein
MCQTLTKVETFHYSIKQALAFTTTHKQKFHFLFIVELAASQVLLQQPKEQEECSGSSYGNNWKNTRVHVLCRIAMSC